MDDKNLTDEQKAHYVEWKRKCAESKKKNLAEFRADHQDGRKPGYKLITRGPRKGKWVPKSYKALRAEKKDAAWAKYQDSKSKRLAREAEEEKLRPSVPQAATPEKRKHKHFDPEILLALFVVTALCLLSFFIAKLFAAFGILTLAVFIDAIFYSLKRRSSPRRRYLPFLWWF